MGFWNIVAVGVAGKAIHKLVKISREDKERREREKEEERIRKNTPCNFDGYISYDEFESLVIDECKRIKRVKSVQIRGPFVYGEYESQSGLSRYSFEIDFNDYGKITGKYWLSQENKDSKVPIVVANNICNRLYNYSEVEFDDSRIESSQGYNDDPFEWQEPNDDTVVNNEREEVAHKTITKTTDINPPLNTENMASFDKKRGKKNIKGIIRRIFIGLGAFFIICCSIFCFYEYKQLIAFQCGADELCDQNYEKVEKILEEMGFSKIETQEIKDLPLMEIARDGLVTDIDLKWKDSFSVGDKYPSNFRILVTYHTVIDIKAPISSEEAKGMNYKDVEDAFRAAGFSDIQFAVEYDIITGWISKEGDVESITINDSDEFYEGSSYHPSAHVVITYHDLIKNKE